nr:O-antigen ligase family protein [Rhodovibrio sodomensis]
MRPAILALVLLAPVALGAAPAWAWASLACLLAGLAMVQGALSIAGAAHAQPWPVPGWTGVPLALLAGLALWQLTAQAPVHPLRLALADALGDPAALLATPVLHRAEARDAVVRVAVPAAVAWLAAQAWAGRPVRPALAALALAGAGVAAHGLAAHALALDQVLWLAGPFHATPTGPFVARGAFAAYLTLAMLAAAAHALTLDARASGLPTVAAWAIMGWALVASQSRAGLAAAVAAHLLLLALAVRGRWLDRRQAAAWAGALLAVAGLGAVATGLDGRLAELPADLEHRLAVWQASLAAIAERPWRGHGLGSFPQLYELYPIPAAAQPVVSAHSVALEWAAEAGVPGALAVFAALLGTAVALRRRPADSPAVLAALPALAAVVLQGAVDPGPQVPGVAATAGLLVGLGLSRGRLSHPPPRPAAR